MKVAALVAGVLATTLVIGCLRHEVEVKPIKIEPIHITVDVNVHVQRDLEDLYSFEKPSSSGTSKPAAPPATPERSTP